MNKPSWNNAPEWANFLAMDEDGTWNWYENEPAAIRQGINYWATMGGQAQEAGWEATLEGRP